MTTWVIDIGDVKQYLVDAESPEEAIDKLLTDLKKCGNAPEKIGLIGMVRKATKKGRTKKYYFVTLYPLLEHDILTYEECEVVIHKLIEAGVISREIGDKTLERLRFFI